MLKRIISMIVLVAVVLCYGVFPVTVNAADNTTPDFTYFQDFEDTTVDGAGITFGANGRRSIVTDNGTKKLLLEGSGGGAYGTELYNEVYYTFPQAVETGVIETSLKANFDFNAGVQAFLAVLNGSEDMPMIMANVYTGWTYYPTKSGEAGKPAPSINPETNMYHLRTVVYRETKAENWTAELYDDAGAEPKLMYATTISADTHSQITGIRLANNWPVVSVQNLMIDDIRIDYYNEVSDFFPSEPEPEPEQPVEFEGFSQNFENTTVEESQLTFDGDGAVSIVADNGTNKLLLDGYKIADYKFPTDIETGVIQSSIKASFVNIDAGAHAFLGVLSGATNRGMLSVYGNWTYYTTEAGEGNMPSPTLNAETNMYHLRTVVYRETKADNWTASLYDDGGEEPKLMYSTTIYAVTHPRITGIRIANTWPVAESPKIHLDDIKIDYYEDVNKFLPASAFTEYSQDFENTTVEESGLTFGANGTRTIVADNGTNKLLLEGGAPDIYNEVYYTFPQAVETGVIETSLKANFEFNDGVQAFLAVLNGSEDMPMIMANVYTGWTYYPTKSGEADKPAPSINPETNMYHLRTVVYRETKADNWTASLYDDSGAEPKLMYSTTIFAKTHPQITGIRLANNWPVAATQNVMIDDVEVKYYKAPHNSLSFGNLKALRGDNFITIKVDVQSLDCEEVPVTAVVAAYSDNETRMTAVNYDTATTNADGSASTLEVTLTGVSSDDLIKIIFVDDLSTLKPLGSAEVISPAIFR